MILRNSIAGVAAALASLASIASEPPPAAPGDAPTALPGFEVIGQPTGDDVHSNAPIIVIDSEQIAATGATTLEQLFQAVPAFGYQGIGSLAAGGYGVYFVDLRGLNFNRTLTLVDGQRYVLSGIKSDEAVDLNNVPIGLIDHIEVLRSGSEPKYGPDAVAGMVNVVLRRDFSGLALTAFGGATTRGDDRTGELTATWGRNFGRGNVTLNAGFFDRGPIRQRDRDFAASPITHASFDEDGGLDLIVGSPATPGGHAVSDDGAVDALVTGPGAARDFDVHHDSYNFATPQDLQGSLRRSTANLLAHYDLTPSLTTSVEVLYSNRVSLYQSAPQALGLAGTAKHPEGFVIAADDPNNFFGEDVALQRVLDEAGPLRTRASADTYRVLAGFSGTLWGDVDWSAVYDHGDSATTYRVANSINLSRAILAAGGCDGAPADCAPANFFGPGSLSPDAVDFFRYTDLSTSDYTEDVVALSAGMPLFTLPGGPVRATLLGELRWETGFTHLDPVTLAGDQAAPDSQNTEGAYRARDISVDASWPIARDVPGIKSLDLDTAVRYSDFSAFGDFPTWKVSLSYAPVGDVRLRGSIGLARRPPALFEAFGGIVANLQAVQDPCDARSGELDDPVVAENCAAIGLPADFTQNAGLINVAAGGNPDLRPESSRSFTIGVVLTPRVLPGVSAAVDYYHYKIDDAIDSLADTDANFIPDTCFASENLSSPFCALIERTPSGPNAGQINRILGLDENIGSVVSNGIDFDLAYRHEWPGGHRVLLDWQSNLLLKHQLDESGEISRYDGHFASLVSVGSYAHFKSLLTGTYRVGNWSVASRINTIGGASVLDEDAQTTPFTSAPAVTYVDALLSYIAGPATYSIGANNLTNRKPPLLIDGISNTNLNTYDVDGTFIYGRVYLAFP